MLTWHVALIEPNRGLVAERVVKAAGFGVFNPKEIIVRQWTRGRTRQSVKLCFPGYLFIQFDLDADGWQRLNRLPGSGIKRLMYAAAESPAVVRDMDLLPLFGLCLANGTIIESVAVDHVKVALGEIVRVIDGPFAGFGGSVESVAGDRVKVGVGIFGRTTLVELTKGMYEKV